MSTFTSEPELYHTGLSTGEDGKSVYLVNFHGAVVSPPDWVIAVGDGMRYYAHEPGNRKAIEIACVGGTHLNISHSL